MVDFARWRHPSFIFSLAVAPGEGLLACGGTEDTPITVWNLADGALVAQLTGLPNQAHALAFSPDASLLAAANVWGGQRVWSVADGRLVDTRPNTSARRTRSLAYRATQPNAQRPIMQSDSIGEGVQRVLAPSGKFVAVSQAGVRVLPYRSQSDVIAQLDPTRYALTRSGVQHLAWSAGSDWLALAGPGWAGAWRSFEAQPAVYAARLPATENVQALAVLGGARQVLYARGPEVMALDLPLTPLAIVLTPWQQFLSRLPPAPDLTVAQARHDWNWNITQWGHEGVDTFGAGLLWYSQEHNTMAGGAALDQDFASFLELGPAVTNGIPEPILVEVCQAVLTLTAQGRATSRAGD